MVPSYGPWKFDLGAWDRFDGLLHTDAYSTIRINRFYQPTRRWEMARSRREEIALALHEEPRGCTIHSTLSRPLWSHSTLLDSSEFVSVPVIYSELTRADVLLVGITHRGTRNVQALTSCPSAMILLNCRHL